LWWNLALSRGVTRFLPHKPIALKKEKYMNQIDRQDPCELLRTAGFTEAEIEYLGRLRRAYREKSSWLTPAEERRLAFVRWLVTTGRLTEQVAWSSTRRGMTPGEGGAIHGSARRDEVLI